MKFNYIATIFFLAMIMGSTMPLSSSDRKYSKNIEQEMRSNTYSKHQHIDVSNNKKTVVTYGTHEFKPLKMFIWFKKVKEQGKKAKLYFKEKPYHSWTKAPKGCPAMNPPAQKQAS
jgi:hypothetical protein